MLKWKRKQASLNTLLSTTVFDIPFFFSREIIFENFFSLKMIKREANLIIIY
jgi:hypothetical protein